VTIADMIGDIDPIKAARRGQDISDELTVHYGLLPRANRGIFAINELPDLAGKIQVGLFNIMQEGDVQIKGYPVRLPLDLLLVFTANPEDYTARGKIITPLKDRIGSEIRTHYPATLEHGIEITRAGSVARPAGGNRRSARARLHRRNRGAARLFGARRQARRQALRRFAAAADFGAGERGVERRAARACKRREDLAVPRVLDIYAALPAITGKIELEYEGELKGGDAVARELIRAPWARSSTAISKASTCAGGAVVRSRRLAEAG
jgi:magnesium chelatase subunit I